MNEIATIEPRARSVTAAMADKFGMDPGPFEQTLRATVFPSGGTREQFAAFLLVAKEYDLNPLTKEIYAFPGKGGGIVPVVSIDGWVTMINRHPNFDGMSFQDNLDSEDQLLSIECSIWRSDRARPIIVTEYLSECYRATDAWKMKHRMLRHKALIQCARYAFGFSGIYDPDEGERIAEAQGGNGFPRLTMPSRRTPPAPPKRRAETFDPETGEIIEHDQPSPAPSEAPESAGGVPPGPAEATPQGPLEGTAVPAPGAAAPSQESHELAGPSHGPTEARPQGNTVPRGAAVAGAGVYAPTVTAAPRGHQSMSGDPEADRRARVAEIHETGDARAQAGTAALRNFLDELRENGEDGLVTSARKGVWSVAARAADAERGRAAGGRA